MVNRKSKMTLLSTVALLAVAVAAVSIGPVIADQGKNNDQNDNQGKNDDPKQLKTKYPIKRLVVIFNDQQMHGARQ